jgi:hypothetical protein
MDSYWIQHVWAKIYIGDKAHQIDVVFNPLKDMGMDAQYTLTLRDKWDSMIDTEEEQSDYDAIQHTFALYQSKGSEAALTHLANNLNHAQQWKIILNRLSTLPTFTSVNKYRIILGV